MSEETQPSAKFEKGAESLTSPEVKHGPKSPETKNKHAESKQTEEIESISHISHKAEKEAKSGGEIQVEENTKVEHSLLVNQKLKNEAFNKTIDQVRTHLSAPERVFSKVAHNSVVDKASEIGAQTIARPVSLLTAGVIAFVGSTVVLFMARHYGFRYNLILFFVLFIAGYLVGLVIEAIRFFVHDIRH